MGSETVIRIGCYVAVFIAIAAWENGAPRRTRSYLRRVRWPGNLGIAALNALLMRLLLPATATGLALAAQAHQWGLLNLVQAPAWVEVLVSIVLLDLAIYFQHVLFHAVPALWRLHRMHHADLDFDVTTGARFHPLEILVSAFLKLTIVAALGPPVLAVLVFEIMLNATSMFNHGNLALPSRVDRLLRRALVTPDMHRVHHSVIARETNSNFGFNLPWWDHLFGTYRDQPAAGHDGMTIGIEQFRDAAELRFDRMLVQPFRRTGGGYAIDSRADEE